eukprot:scaffold450868_cov53-Prasinocladus_malaysianus.AAC.1
MCIRGAGKSLFGNGAALPWAPTWKPANVFFSSTRGPGACPAQPRGLAGGGGRPDGGAYLLALRPQPACPAHPLRIYIRVRRPPLLPARDGRDILSNNSCTRDHKDNDVL